MAFYKETMFLLLLFMSSSSFSLSRQEPKLNNNYKTKHDNNNNSNSLSLSFTLTALSLSKHPLKPSKPLNSLVSSKTKQDPSLKSSKVYDYKSSFKYTMALVVSLPIGTPPQLQEMVLDTGSQLSWIQCNDINKKSTKKSIPSAASGSSSPSTTSFDPSLSSSFSVLPCNNPLCRPRNPDFTLPTSCDEKRLCHYSYFYADGTLAEGNLVSEKFAFSNSQSTPPLALGCAQASTDDKGILGMNLGRLSFASQARISKFSYCVPARQGRTDVSPSGLFYLGENPNSGGFQYVGLLTISPSQRSLPNLDPLAYSVAMQGIRIGNKKLDIPVTAFLPDSSGAGQTMIDSGSEFTYLADVAYNKVREEIVRLVGPKMKKDYVYANVADMCFDGIPVDIGKSIGDMAFEFEKGVEIVIEKEKILTDVENGVSCIGIGRSDMLGASSNIIGNFHQQNLWVEFDLASNRVGFGKADCSGSAM